VVDHCLLIVTRQFGAQESTITTVDFAAHARALPHLSGNAVGSAGSLLVRTIEELVLDACAGLLTVLRDEAVARD
jgi:ATP adenylyltransferase/5',5'''-P-1,P-4-tetraphosphate phosphorylase II